MGKLKKKTPYKPKVVKPQAPAASQPEGLAVEKVAELAVDVWKIESRAKSVGENDRVLAACERATDRFRKFGFEIRDLTGDEYDTNMRVNVVEHEAKNGPLIIAECLSPAVYFEGLLIREAEVVTSGNGNS